MGKEASITADLIDGVYVLTIFGEVDISNADELSAQLDQAADTGAPGVVIDLTHAAYFDSRTISLLAKFAERSRSERQGLALVVPGGGWAGRILEITGLPRIVPSWQTVGEAVASVKQTAVSSSN